MKQTLGNPYTHAIMFHHFHNEVHPMGQGSISATQFEIMIDWLSERYSILNPNEYLYKLKNETLLSSDICLTFDDALLCQADIAAPILNSKNIQAFFFIYSSPFMGKPDNLEIYRYFRTTHFRTIDDFYNEFFEKTKVLIQSKYDIAKKNYDENEYLKDYKFYTQNDKWFRFLRDYVLERGFYDGIMHQLMVEHKFNYDLSLSKLWMNNKHLTDLQSDGHLIGLHSYSHPTTIHLLDKEIQEDEYKQNYRHLSEILSTEIKSMSHPCGNYNSDTLNILNDQGIEIGFRSTNNIKKINSKLEIPRKDHAVVLKEMTQ